MIKVYTDYSDSIYTQNYSFKMKRQKNMQLVKECGKNQPGQTQEEEIGNLPEREFRITIVKMIQNLENKMEAQVNRLEE